MFKNPDATSIIRSKTINMLPGVHQTDTLMKFFHATVDHLFQPGSAQAVNGYIGQRPWYAASTDSYLSEPTSLRAKYQLEVSAIALESGEISNLMTYPDFINYLRHAGANVSNHDRLFSQSYQSWCPPINPDMLVNFREYFWLQSGPPPVLISPNILYTGDGRVKQFPLPATGQVFVTLNGQPMVAGTHYSIVDGKVVFYHTPPADSQIVLRQYREIILADIIGKSSYQITVNDTTTISLSSGMVIAILQPDGMERKYIVEGVGRSIRLIEETVNIIDCSPYARFQNATIFPIPDGSGPVLVRKNDVDQIENVHYQVNGNFITFNSGYEPDADDITEIWRLADIDLDAILRQPSATLPTGVELANGMVIRLTGNLTSATIPSDELATRFANKTFIVSNVGQAIALTEYQAPTDGLDFPDYIVMERGESNPWSSGNRWFHRDVIDFSQLPTAPQQAVRPIIEFIPLPLYQYGVNRRPDIAAILSGEQPVTVTNAGVDHTYPAITSLFTEVAGMDAVKVGDYLVQDGDRLLITTDADDLINNRIYRVGRTSANNIRLTLENDRGTESAMPSVSDIVRVKSTGEEWYFKGEWKLAQKKTTINQPPLFAAVDDQGIDLDDPGIYPNSTFAGNKVFSYATGNGTVDTVLQMPVIRRKNGTASEILFINHLTDTYHYGDALNPTPIAGWTVGGVTGWWDAGVSKQTTTTVTTVSASSASVDIPYMPKTRNDITVKQNGIVLPSNGYTLDSNTVYLPTAGDGDVVEVSIWSDQPNGQEFDVPVNLQYNPLNENVREITRSGFFAHFTEIIGRQKSFTGKVFAGNNFRDTARNLSLGGQILRHSAPMLPAMILASDTRFDLQTAYRTASREYYRTKNKILQIAERMIVTGQMDDNATPAEWLTAILDEINLGKTPMDAWANATIPFIPHTPAMQGITAQYEVKPFLINGAAYLQNHDGSTMLAYGDIRDLIMLEFETRCSSITPAPGSHPTVHQLVEGKFRKHHARVWTPGSAIAAGDTVWYEGRHYRLLVDTTDLPAALQAKQAVETARTQYSYAEFIDILSPMAERWASAEKQDIRRNDTFDYADVWSWNYRGVDADGQPIPGGWKGIYLYYYDTIAPHTRPWEMIGLTAKPSWWDTEYGAAPYTKGNARLWKDLETGWNAGSQTIVLEYARPGLSAYIPVDDQGNLLPPHQIGIVSATLDIMQAGRPWQMGDVGPVEAAWMKSEDHPFAMCAALTLMKPAHMAISPARRYLDEYLIGIGYDPAMLESKLAGCQPRLAYRVGGFTNADQLTVTADNYQIIPSDDIAVSLFRSPPIREEVYSGVIIQVTDRGWKVFGYDVLKPRFTIMEPIQDGPATSFTLGGSNDIREWRANTSYPVGHLVIISGSVYRCRSAHTSTRSIDYDLWDITTATPGSPGLRIVQWLTHGGSADIPYGTEFYNQTDLYNFLIGYQKHLESRGWVFDQVQDGEDVSFAQMGKRAALWTLINTRIGAFIALSPFSKGAKFTSAHGTIDSVEDISSGVYSILNKSGYPISVKDTFVTRNDDTLTIQPNVDEIFAVRLTVSEIEHVVVFNNRTSFNDIVYEPLLGLRQPRLKIQGNRTIDWNGRLHAPGFIIGQNSITANFDTSISDIRYQFEHEYPMTTHGRYAKHLYGFTNKPSWDRLIPNTTSQWDVYRGMLRHRGTAAAMTALLRSRRISNGADVSFKEEWAFRIGHYGAVDGNSGMEIQLKQSQIDTDPQMIVFANLPGGEKADSRFDDRITIMTDDERWISRPTLPPLGAITSYKLYQAGNVRDDEVAHTVLTHADLANRIGEAGKNERVWVSRDLDDWDVVQLQDRQITIDALSVVDGRVQVNTNATTGQTFIVEEGQGLPAGRYQLGEAVETTQEWTIDFSQPALSPVLRTVERTFDISEIRGDLTSPTPAGIFRKKLIESRDLAGSLYIRNIQISTLGEGNNLRGYSSVTHRPTDRISDAEMLAVFGKSSGAAYPITVLGDNVTILIDVDGNRHYGNWQVVGNRIWIDSLATDVTLHQISNPKMAIGTFTDAEKFFRFANTPAINDPAGVIHRSNIPYWLSSGVLEDIWLSLDPDGATSGTIVLTFEIVQLMTATTDARFDIKNGSITGLSIEVKQPFTATNAFGDNSLYIGDGDNPARFVSPATFPPSNLQTAATYQISADAAYTSGSITVNFQPAWTAGMIATTSGANERAYDYFTTPDEFYRQMPNTFDPATSDIDVLVNGISRNEFSNLVTDDWSLAEWSVYYTPDYNAYVYFGSRQSSPLYDVGVGNTILHYPLPGSPTVNALVSGSTIANVATVTTAGGGINDITVINGGENYIDGKTVVDIIGDGTGAAAKALVSHGEVVAVLITDPGSSYTTAIARIRDISGRLVDDQGRMAEVSLSLDGKGISGYQANTHTFTSIPTLQVVGNGVGATASPVLKSKIAAMAVSGGVGYTFASAVVRQPLGREAACTAILSGNGTGSVVALPVTNYGYGYTVVPTVTLSPSPSGDTATATARINDIGQVIGYTITHPGSGYITPPAVTITAQEGVVETISAFVSGGQVTGIANPTSIFTFDGALPLEITITGDGTGAGATVTAIEPVTMTGVRPLTTGTNYTLTVGEEERLEVRAAAYSGTTRTSPWVVFREMPELAGYKVVGNGIHFQRPVQMDGYKLEIVRHSPIRISREDDVRIIDRSHAVTPSATGEMTIRMQIKNRMSELIYLGPVDGGPQTALPVSDRLTLPITLSVKTYASVRYDGLSDLSSRSWLIGDLAWLRDYDRVMRYEATGWVEIRRHRPSIDPRRITHATIWDTATQRPITHLQYHDPLRGYLPGIAASEITYQTAYDPARYSEKETTTLWGTDHVGELWWDTGKAIFHRYDIGDMNYRRDHWGSLNAVGEINIYEWVESPVPPARWAEYADDGDGSVRNETDFTVITSPTGVVRYYFWVTGRTVISPKRSMSTEMVRQSILYPTANDLPWFAFADTNTLLVGGFQRLLNDTSTTLRIKWSDATSTPAHTEWILLREGDGQTPIPQALMLKLRDSLVGFGDPSHVVKAEDDTFNIPLTEELRNAHLVPDPALPVHMVLGTDFRPAQTMFRPTWANGRWAPSIAARRHFREVINDILYQSVIRLPDKTAAHPSGKRYEVLNEVIGNRTFALPKNFKTEGMTVTVISPSGVETPRQYGLHYTVERQQGIDVIVFTANTSPINQDPRIYSKVVAREYLHPFETVPTVDDLREVIVGQKVLIENDARYDGLWSLVEWTGDEWKTIRVCDYRTRDAMTTIDWWKNGVDAEMIVATYPTTAHRNAANPIPTTGMIVQVDNDGTGRWQVSRWSGDTWEIVGREQAVSQISDGILADKLVFHPTTDYAAITEQDIRNRDFSMELKVILNELMVTLDSDSCNRLFFAMNYFAHTQSTAIDWSFKTSYLYVAGYDEPLRQTPVQTVDLSTALLDYINEVKPYHVKVRDYVRRLAPDIDVASMYVTDFDKPVTYDNNAYRPLVLKGRYTYEAVEEDRDTLESGYWPYHRPVTESGKQYWADWYYNFGKLENQTTLANPSLIRTFTITSTFARVGNTISTGYRNGWGGDEGLLGWDGGAWDHGGFDQQTGNNLAYYPQYGMPGNRPEYLIPGVNYRGVILDSGDFTTNDYDVQIESTAIDADDSTVPWAIDVNGGNLTDPYWDADHPPELIRSQVRDTFLMDVYQTYTPGAPIIHTTRTFATVSATTIDGKTAWGPFRFESDHQSVEAVDVFVSGVALPAERIHVDEREKMLWIFSETNPLEGADIEITAVSVGGGTPYQMEEFLADGVSNQYRIPAAGQMMDQRIFIHAEFTRDIVINGKAHSTGYREELNDIASNGSTIIAVGDAIENVITAITVPTPTAATATVKTQYPHGLVVGMTVTLSGITPAAFNGSFTVVSILGLDEFVITDPAFVGITDPGSGMMTLVSQPRVIWQDGNFWRASLIPASPSVNLNAVAYNGQFVAVGDDGLIVTSMDGVNWNIRHQGGGNLNAVSFVQGHWMAVGESSLLTSLNGSTWTQQVTVVAAAIPGNIELTGKRTAFNRLNEYVTPAFLATLPVGHTGLSDGAYGELNYRDTSGNPIEPNDGSPYLWEVDTVTITNPGHDGLSGSHVVTVVGGEGRAATILLTVEGGQVVGHSLVSKGEYSVKPHQHVFQVAGSAVGPLGLPSGNHFTVDGMIANPLVPAGSRLTINETTITFKTESDLDAVIAKINTAKNISVVASKIDNRLRLTIPPIWKVVERYPGTLPAECEINLTFRPIGATLAEQALQGMMVWEDGWDVLLLERNAIYRFNKTGDTYTFTDERRPALISDLNDGVSYWLDGNVYRRAILSLHGIGEINNRAVIVGRRSTILGSENMTSFAVMEPADNLQYDLFAITGTPTGLLAVGEDGYMTESDDGITWKALPRMTGNTLVAADYASSLLLAGGRDGYWEGDELKSYTRADVRSGKWLNGVSVFTHGKTKKTVRLYDGVDYTRVGDMAVWPDTMPVIARDHKIRIANYGTAIRGKLVSDILASNTYVVPGTPLATQSVMVAIDGHVLSPTEYTVTVTDHTTVMLINPPPSGQIVIHVFGGDHARARTDTFIVNDLTFKSGVMWETGYVVGTLSQLPSGNTLDGSLTVRRNGIELLPPDLEYHTGDGNTRTYPINPSVHRQSVLRVWVDGVEQSVGIAVSNDVAPVEKVDEELITGIRFAIAPPAGSKIRIAIYGDHQFQVSSTGELLLYPMQNLSITRRVHDAHLPVMFGQYVPLTATITVTVNDVPVSWTPVEHKDRIVGVRMMGLVIGDVVKITVERAVGDTIMVGDVITVTSYAENSAMEIATELFRGSSANNVYIIRNQPASTDNIRVSVNGVTQYHMRDYEMRLLTVGGWDAFPWGGLEQYGAFHPFTINPLYNDYIAAGGRPPVWTGRHMIDGMVGDSAGQTVEWLPWASNRAYSVGDIAYTVAGGYIRCLTAHTSTILDDDSLYWERADRYSGPTVYHYPSADTIHGPPTELYSWDSTFRGAAVRFDTAHHEADRIKITTYAGKSYHPPFAWRVFANPIGKWESLRLSDRHMGELVDDLSVTSDERYQAGDRLAFELENGQVIRVAIDQAANPFAIPTPGNHPVVWIGGERIKYGELRDKDENGLPLIVDGRKIVELRALTRGSEGTSHGVSIREEKVRVTDGRLFKAGEPGVPSPMNGIDLPYRTVDVWLNDTHLYERQYWEDRFQGQGIDDGIQYFTYADGRLTIWEMNARIPVPSIIPSDQVVNIVGLIDDERFSRITHRAGSLVRDGSWQQKLTGFRPFHAQNINPFSLEKPIGLAASDQRAVKFLIAGAGQRREH